MKADGMNYAPKGKPRPVVGPGEFFFSAMALDHGHIYGMCNGLIEAGATLKYVYDPDPDKVALRSRMNMTGEAPVHEHDAMAGLNQFQIKPGTVTFCRLQEYDGEWKNGKQHGVGVYTSASGNSKKGEWADGRRVNWLK